MKWATGILCLVAIALFPHQAGEALGTMTMAFPIAYFSLKAKLQPFLAFAVAVLAQAAYLVLFGSPDTSTPLGLTLFAGVPLVLSFAVVKLLCLRPPKPTT